MLPSVPSKVDSLQSLVSPKIQKETFDILNKNKKLTEEVKDWAKLHHEASVEASFNLLYILFCVRGMCCSTPKEIKEFEYFLLNDLNMTIATFDGKIGLMHSYTPYCKKLGIEYVEEVVKGIGPKRFNKCGEAILKKLANKDTKDPSELKKVIKEYKKIRINSKTRLKRGKNKIDAAKEDQISIAKEAVESKNQIESILKRSQDTVRKHEDRIRSLMQILGITDIDLLDDDIELIKEILYTSETKSITEFFEHYKKIVDNSKKYTAMMDIVKE